MSMFPHAPIPAEPSRCSVQRLARSYLLSVASGATAADLAAAVAQLPADAAFDADASRVNSRGATAVFQQPHDPGVPAAALPAAPLPSLTAHARPEATQTVTRRLAGWVPDVPAVLADLDRRDRRRATDPATMPSGALASRPPYPGVDLALALDRRPRTHHRRGPARPAPCGHERSCVCSLATLQPAS